MAWFWDLTSEHGFCSDISIYEDMVLQSVAYDWWRILITMFEPDEPIRKFLQDVVSIGT